MRASLNDLADRRRVHAVLRRLVDIGLVREVPRAMQLLEPTRCRAILQLVDVIAAGLHKRGYYAAWHAAWLRDFRHGRAGRRPPATGTVSGETPISALAVDPRFERLSARMLSEGRP